MNPIDNLVQSSGSVFEDLGFPPDEASVLQMRAELLCDLREYIAAGGLSVDQAAERLGLTLSRASALVKGDCEEFSLETLIGLETRLGRTVTL